MAYRDEAPYRPQDVQEVAEMLRALEGNKGKGKSKGAFSTKKNTFEVAGTDITVDSWKMQEWDYKKPHLPTYARGLFTTRTRKGQPEIATRGYDKFFNHGEVRETEWQNVEQNTRGPYELSVKENGCIIFISGLEDGTLLVCSKHSTGSRGDTETSHAQAGERWVERHLASVGKTKQDLAMKLRQMNATAVAELCDDEFEEHVLAYAPETAGLYLHGINLNLPEFATYPHHLVDQFADEWGFKKTQYVIKDNIHEVKDFLDKVAETGNYEARDTEGFVIRCQSKANTNVWHDWFFKYKFEEPYLMYRQWRECTKAIIGGRETKYKKHKQITEKYIDFARRQLHGNPQLAKEYNLNHGIIKMRDDFLAEVGLRGYDIIRQEEQQGEVSNDAAHRDIILVPVATIGCGKTTVALALCKLFGWGHIQNDNITVKRGKPQAFAQACAQELVEHSAMVADRNNHQRRERRQLIEDVQKIVPNTRFVALHFVHDRGNYNNIRAALQDRVLSRGDNHQTIHTSRGAGEIIGIMEGFLHRFEPVNPEAEPDDAFDTVVDLDPISSSRQNLETVISRLYTEYPKLFGDQDMPTSDDMDAAIEAAMHDYQVDLKHEIKGRDDRGKGNKNSNAHPNAAANGAAKPKERKVEYFATQLPAARVSSVLQAMFADAPADVARMYNTLKNQRRIQSEFHVTLIHRATASQHADQWAHLNDLHTKASAPTPSRDFVLPDAKIGTSKVRLERLVWDDRIMAFVVRLSPAEGSTELFNSVNQTAHVTVGTASPDVKPKESNDLLARWLREGSGQNGIYEMTVKGNVELEGVVKGVLSR
ncbi:tRNA ligase 1 [Fulvia fulva]|uniref:tRNA ligase n=1 Tax=Passalora fulva TaxID=5499 RepID=A0A9Q8P2V8_PASFU|nr:tRNA ligase 1 [Fulvia fulva]KAK4635845.1 tRNA ligase 1 [Fulvia fulva]KAK4636433.1 tRNA ligase 1 [Fulvia fulva]UJO11101.1 tRNA ligase 1 [Fulvia fulva]WPV09224.1 tRNA ligase 1 [Fulvia fulva]WPV23055.1 tRNA ligase 1 [Fulvia fulva]